MSNAIVTKRKSEVAAPAPLHRRVRNIAAGLCTGSVLLGAYAAFGDPPLPDHVIAAEITLQPTGNIAFDTDLGKGLKAICFGKKPVEGFTTVAALTLDYGACSKHTLTLIPAVYDPSECATAGAETALRLTDIPLGCGAQLLVTDGARNVKPLPVNGEALLLFSRRPKILGDLRLDGIDAARSQTTNAVSGALLADGIGHRVMAATWMRLVQVLLLPKGEHDLPSTGDALKVDFAEPAMGHVTEATFDGRDHIWSWRLTRVLAAMGTGLAGLFAGWIQSRLRGAVATP